jgi:ribonucleoside-diphosphate reductase alpha chain
MVSAGFPHEVDVTKDSTLVFSFPVHAPVGSVCASDVGAIGQLELWKAYAEHYCEHKPSITVYYTDDEFFDVCSWMWRNFDILSGIALLPRADHSYAQAPYQAVSSEVCEALEASIPRFDWTELAKFEQEDTTTGSQELACVGNSCEFTGV